MKTQIQEEIKPVVDEKSKRNVIKIARIFDISNNIPLVVKVSELVVDVIKSCGSKCIQ